MSVPTFLLILLSVSMSSLAQVALKHGMSSSSVQAALTRGGMTSAVSIGTNGFVLGGLLLYGLGAIVWLKVLAKIDVSIAYPFVAMGFILTMALAVAFLDEKIVLSRVVGTVLIALGAVLVAKS
jgi:uncharacterized membrane protein